LFPVCALSGTLFTLLGTALRARMRSAIDAAAVITVANTLGGLFGALLGGFVLLPRLGVETSVFVAALAYGAAGLTLVYALGPEATSADLSAPWPADGLGQRARAGGGAGPLPVRPDARGLRPARARPIPGRRLAGRRHA
jgi:hypothetical protein